MKLPDFFLTRPDWYIAASTRVDAAVCVHEFCAPAWMDGMTALFVSDIHLTARMDVDSFASLLTQQQADLVLMGGDYADTKEQTLRLFGALRNLKAPMGIFAVCGNNDSEAFASHEELTDALSAFGAKLLVNECVRSGEGLCIGGLDEPKHGRPDCHTVFPEKHAGDFRILLSHYPLRHAIIEARPDLMLCGHTHGGQFNAFGVTPYSIGFEQIGKDRFDIASVSGVKQSGGTTLLVSKGIGGSRIPLRIGVRPEIHRITFRCKC